jgi:hypothetical protein
MNDKRDEREPEESAGHRLGSTVRPFNKDSVRDLKDDRDRFEHESGK